MRSRPVDISFLEEARDTLSHRSSSFHVINQPQSKGGLKYFIRLGAIGFAYSGGFFGSSSIVPRQFEAPQRQANFFLAASVIGSSISIR
jgi:predicted permease